MGVSFGNLPSSGGFNPYTFQPSSMYTDPTKPPPGQEGGSWVWDAAKGVWNFFKGNAGDLLQTGAGILEGYMSSQDRQKQLDELQRQFNENLKERQQEFERTTGDQEAQAAVQAQTALNKAPIADKAQALILSRMGVSPGTFQPRDYTQGVSTLARPFTAPSANVTQAMQTAANNYQPGQGGVDTSTIQMLLNRMKGTAFPGASTPTANRPAPPRPRPNAPGTLLPVPPDPRVPGVLRPRKDLPQ